MRKLFRLLLCVLLMLALIIGGFLGWRFWHEEQLLKRHPRLVQAKDGTSISPAWSNLSNYEKQLKKKYPYIYRSAFIAPARSYYGQATVIPGLVTTRSYNFNRGKFDTAKAMTPQGITFAGPFILISAYDGDHDHASVIYVLRKNGHYVKTVQIQGRPHLGGIAYDSKAKNIWLTGSRGDRSTLASFSLTALKKYPLKSRKPIAFAQDVDLPSMQKASAVTYFDDQLFVGYFNMYGKGQIAGYRIARSGASAGSITNNEIKAANGSVTWSDPSGQSSMARRIQGLAFANGQVFLSQSYGSSDSKLYIFPVTALHDLNVKNAERVIALPPYLEQIQVYKGQLICLFESGARKYARPGIMVMDRLLSLNINSLFSD